MKHRIVTDSAAREFRLLRNRVEAEIHAPSVLLVTSATEHDGAGMTAFGLAESLSHTHQRTALVTSSQAPPLAPGEQAVAPQQRRRASDRLQDGDSRHVPQAGKLTVVAISHERQATISRSAMAELVQDLRTHHDYVVIDGGDLPNNSFGLLLATSADAILVTFQTGRKQLVADRTMLDMLERSEAKMLGVVMNERAAIDHFNNAHDEAAEPVPAGTEKAPAGLPRLDVALKRIGNAF